MAVLGVKTYPDKILRQKAQSVDDITEADRLLIRNMFDTMYFSNGVGLAAPQVGVSKRIIVCNPTGKKADEIAIINPVITYKKGKKIKECEGCLSIPTISHEVARPYNLEVTGVDSGGNGIRIEAEGLLARIIAHETDHLDGVLFIDRVGFLQRKILVRKYKKKMGISCVGRWY